MLYHAFDMQKSWLAGASALATAGAQAMQHPANPLGYFGGSPLFASALEVFAHAAAPRGKPGFDLYETVVDGETGLLVPPHEEASLAKAIVTLLKDPAKRAAMGDAGRARVEKEFSVDRLVNNTLGVYQRRRPS